MMLNAATSLNARTSLLTLFLAALQGLGSVNTSAIPLPQTASYIHTVYRETASDSPVRRTASNRNGLTSVCLEQGWIEDMQDRGSSRSRIENHWSKTLLHRYGSPFLHRPALSHKPRLQLGLQGAEVKGTSGWGPPAPSLLLPPERDSAPAGRERNTTRKRRKRTQTVDSSDPLCLHGQRGRCSQGRGEEEQTPEPEADASSDQTHAISKETIASTSDDPFNVVQPPGGAGSPRSVGSDKALTKKRTAAEGDGPA